MNLRDLKYLGPGRPQAFRPGCRLLPSASPRCRRRSASWKKSWACRWWNAHRAGDADPGRPGSGGTGAGDRVRSGTAEGGGATQPRSGSRHGAPGHLPDPRPVPAAACDPAHPRALPGAGTAAGRGKERRAAGPPARRQARRRTAGPAGDRRPAACRIPVRGTVPAGRVRAPPAGRREHLDVQELATQKLLLLEDGHCLRDQALEVCRRSAPTRSPNSAPPAWKPCGRWSPPTSASPCCRACRCSRRCRARTTSACSISPAKAVPAAASP